MENLNYEHHCDSTFNNFNDLYVIMKSGMC